MPMPVSANYPKFTNDELYRFINEYEKHRMLYDFDHPLYTNYVERTRRFAAISRSLKIDGLTAERVRAKIKVFRGNYTHRLKEFYKKQKSGEPFNAPHWWYMADKFLRAHIRFLDPDVGEGQHPTPTNPNHFTIQPTQNSSASEAEIYFGSDMPVSSTVEVIEEPANYVEEEMPQSQPVKPVK
uniref:MADF domain-containing protein n=1 Tax=Lygus hesperus TaxID=30085 RepID=A0A0K8T3Y3_LYGHE